MKQTLCIALLFLFGIALFIFTRHGAEADREVLEVGSVDEITLMGATQFDAIPAIIVLGTVLLPLAVDVGMHPIHFAMIGVISLAFGLVTPPYGLCLLITCSLGEIKKIDALKDVAVVLTPMLALLIVVILFPEFVLFLPGLLTPQFL